MSDARAEEWRRAAPHANLSRVNTLRLANLALRFALEVGALIAVGYWGWSASMRPFARAALAVVVPVVVAVVWGLFISPKARFPAGLVGRAILGLLVFLVAAAALYGRGHARLGMTFGGLAVVSSALLLLPSDPDAAGSP